MKKSILITLISIIAIISLMFVFVACNGDNNPTPATPDEKTGDLSNSDFYEKAAGVTNPKIVISLISVVDNKEVYSRSSSGAESNPHAIPNIDGGSYIDSATAFAYRDDYFSSTSIKGKLLTAIVDKPMEYLGVTDEGTTIENAKVVIELDKNNNLKSIDVTFDMTVDTIAYKATITITP